jgi:hypothetical protein
MLARECQQGLFVQKIAEEMLVHATEHCIIFNEWGEGVRDLDPITLWDGEAKIEGVTEVAGVTQVVTGRDSGSIGRRKCGEQRVAVRKIDPELA